jgi:hypothetical protein
MQIILKFPIARGEKLQQLGDRLPEALDRALQELTPPETIPYQEELQPRYPLNI